MCFNCRLSNNRFNQDENELTTTNALEDTEFMTNKKDMEVKITDREDINERITEKPTNPKEDNSRNNFRN